MVVYHAITTFHLIQAWVHKWLFHLKDETLFVYDDVMDEKFQNIKLLEEKGVFSKVYPIPYRKSPRDREKIVEWMDDVFSNLEIESAEEIYVAGAQFYFSDWLISHNIPFIFCEEASGRLSKPEVVMENDQVLNKLRYEIAMRNGMYTGNHELVTKKIYNKKAQKDGFYDERAIDFDVVEGIAKLSNLQRMQILQFFNAPMNLKINQNSVIILTQHFTNLKMMSLKQQVELYQQTVDYYLEEYFPIIKVHPDDQIFYRQILKKCMVIDTKFPSELLPYIFTNIPKMIATISSTGIYSFLKIFEDSLNFNPAYEKNYPKNHQFYLIGVVIKEMWKNHYVSLKYIGENLLQLENMLQQSVKIQNAKFDENANILIIDQIYEGNIDANQMCIIVEAEKQGFLCQWMKENRQKLVSKKIYISKHGKLLKKETIFFYCPNKKSKEDILGMSYVKRLNNSDLEIVVMDETELENQVLVLEGILKATEERLLYLLNEKESTRGTDIE